MKQKSSEKLQDRSSAKPKRTRFLYKFIMRAAVVAAIIGCTVTVVSIQSNIAQKQTELHQIQTQVENMQADNADLKRIIDSGDIDAYMEKLAREDYGYAYPDEFRFYDTSRN